MRFHLVSVRITKIKKSYQSPKGRVGSVSPTPFFIFSYFFSLPFLSNRNTPGVLFLRFFLSSPFLSLSLSHTHSYSVSLCLCLFLSSPILPPQPHLSSFSVISEDASPAQLEMPKVGTCLIDRGHGPRPLCLPILFPYRVFYYHIGNSF